MNKCKIIKRKGMRMLLVKGEKGQQLSEWELNHINSNQVSGLLQVAVRKKGFCYHLEFDITGYITFREFLQIPMTQESFTHVLQNILDNLHSVKEKHFNEQLILYDMDKVYINPATQRLFFTYVPLQPFENNKTLQEMLLDIISYCAFDESEDTEYVTEYISILNRGINFSQFDLEEYVQRMLKTINGEYDGETVECPKCGSLLPASAVVCSCGRKMQGVTGSTNSARSQVYDMFQNGSSHHPVKVAASNEHIPTASAAEDKHADTKPPQRKKQTTVLSLYDDEEIDAVAHLLQISTGEKISIDKTPFRLGRESGDYVIPNCYISEPHMDIIRRGNRFFAVDLDSRNKSYIDKEVLVPRQETELVNGCQLKLANEKFQVTIE